MRVYGLSFLETMNLPMRAFWHLSGTVPRLLAGENKDQLELMSKATHSPEGAQELHTSLQEMAPEPVRVSTAALVKATSVRDAAGFEELRRMAQ